MALFIKIAWRGIWRNSRRSMLTISAVVFATMLSVVMRGMQLGTYDSMISNLVRTYVGFLQIQVPGYLENPTLHKAFTVDNELKEFLRGVPGVAGFTERIQADGLISVGEQSQGSMIMGIRPESERLVSNIHEKVKEGTFLLNDSSKQVVVGFKLMKNLNAHVGDRIIILAQGYDGSLGNDAYTIVGSIKTGMPEFDGMAVFMGLHDARDLLGMPDKAHALAISLQDLHTIEEVQTQIADHLKGRSLSVLAWNQVSPELQRHIELDNISGILMLAILIIIVAFGILNTVLMSVTERFREFGVMLAIGMKNDRLVRLVFAETILMTLIGIVLGDAIAWGINYYIVQNPIALPALESVTEQFGIDYRLMSTVRPSIFLNSSLAVLAISLVMTLYPLFRVGKLEPLRGLRFT